MIITKAIEVSLRERLKATDGGIKAAAALGGITHTTAHKILGFRNVTQESYDAFCDGLTMLEKQEANQMIVNANRALATA